MDVPQDIRRCTHCTTIINTYHKSDTCYLHEDQENFFPDSTDILKDEPRICSNCGNKSLAPQNTTGKCKSCLKDIHKDRKKNFRSYIVPADKAPVKNPTCKDIAEIIAHAYQIATDRVLGASSQKQEDVWTRRLALYLISEDLKISVPKHIPHFYDVTAEKISSSSWHVTQKMQEDEMILRAVKDIRSRYRFT